MIEGRNIFDSFMAAAAARHPKRTGNETKRCPSDVVNTWLMISAVIMATGT